MARIKADVLDGTEVVDENNNDGAVFTEQVDGAVEQPPTDLVEAPSEVQTETNPANEAPASEERLDAATGTAPEASSDQAAPTDGVAPTDGAPAPEAAAPTEPKPVDLEPFKAVILEAKDSMDPQSGQPTEASVTKVQEAYRDLETNKAKSDARKLVESLIHERVHADDLMGAKCLMFLAEQMRVGTKGAGKKADRTPQDLTTSYIEKRVTLDLARMSLPKPEGLADDTDAKGTELYNNLWEPTQVFIAWLNGDKETRGDEPDVSPIAKAAAKLALGAKAKAGGSTSSASSTSGTTRAPYTGAKRSIVAHIAQAFENEPSGKFLKVSEIVKFKSTEYGDTPPSAGAISASLKNNKVPDGVEVATENGLGARKK
jgi:hypothetical protein